MEIISNPKITLAFCKNCGKLYNQTRADKQYCYLDGCKNGPQNANRLTGAYNRVNDIINKKIKSLNLAPRLESNNELIKILEEVEKKHVSIIRAKFPSNDTNKIAIEKLKILLKQKNPNELSFHLKLFLDGDMDALEPESEIEGRMKNA
jgi:hypothetical protein